VPSDQLHHSGILVADMERAATFYLEVFDGRYLFKPAVNRGPSARFVMGGDSDAIGFAFCYIGFGTGAIELMQFVADPPAWAVTPRTGILPHFAMRVDDVDETVRRVVEHGGRLLWPEPMDWGGRKVMYVADPDGTPIELFDVPLQDIVDATLELYPDSTP
jgi:glyoxylase I family protein